MLGDTSFRVLFQVFGYLYPGYLCFKDIQGNKIDKIRLWSMYWVLMAAFTVAQSVADTFLFFIPFYYSAKLAFACYLWANNLAGAELVYSRYVKPFVLQHEPMVDSKISELKLLVSELVSSNFARCVQWLQAKFVAALVHSQQIAANSLRAEPSGEAAPAAGFRASDSFRSASSSLGLRTFSIKDE